MARNIALTEVNMNSRVGTEATAALIGVPGTARKPEPDAVERSLVARMPPTLTDYETGLYHEAD